jgi:hypothetical protein
MVNKYIKKDYRKNETAQFLYKLVNNRWNMPNRYYLQKFSINGFDEVVFFILDTNQYVDFDRELYPNLGKTNKTEQFLWFKSNIEALDNVKYKFVIGHQ